MTVDLYDDALLTELDKAAKAVAFDYDKWISKDDLYQEAFEWVLRHPQLTESLTVAGTLRRTVQDHLRLVAQKERAQKVGFLPDDVEYYTPAGVAGLLPDALDKIEALSPTGYSGGGGRGSGDPHSLSGFLCSLIDVANAWINTAFRDDERQLIDARYIADLNWAEIAHLYGHEVEECKRRVAVGLRRMVEFLGGYRGRSCGTTCPDCTQREVDSLEGQGS